MVIAEKPSLIKSSSVVSRFKVPEAPARPIVVDAVLGAMIKVLVPEMLVPMEIASVVIDQVLAPIAIVPPLPVTREPAVTEVAPNTLPPPTAPLKVVVAEPELIATVGVEAVE